ncbi:MAG: acyl-protein synthetase, partial [Lachnospiraceae bacterium]|nr:acyl-protein synthetase [Lachnospiraceae bacterium]
MNLEEVLQIPPYSLKREEKEKLLTARLLELTEHHRRSCPEYAHLLKALSYREEKIHTYADLPFLPVRLFKEVSLKSVPQEDIVKTMTSSGTSGQGVSKIYLDRETASAQQKALVKIVSNFTGSGRMPMIILDCPSVIKNRAMFSARGAGILGFSIFGAKKIYAFDDDMALNVKEISAFLEKFQGQKILLFGFTYMIWQYFYKKLVDLGKSETPIDLSNGIL